MLLKEFEDRMNGNTVNPEVFDNLIHPIYMMTDLDKDAFCDDWKLHGHSAILTAVAAEAIAQKKGVENAIKMHDDYVEKTTRQLIKVAEHLITIADDCACAESYDLAVELVGQKFVTSFKVREGMDLNETDKAFILNTLG